MSATILPFKFGYGELVTEENRKRPDKCQKCSRLSQDLKIQENSQGIRTWMCGECRKGYIKFMGEYYLKWLSFEDANLTDNTYKGRYRRRIHNPMFIGSRGADL